MWPKKYKDNPVDTPLKREQVQSGRGIVGVEMHDLNGWGEEHHIPGKQKKGLFARLFGGRKKP